MTALPRGEGGRLHHSDRHMIWNCRDVYTAKDVANHFGVALDTVRSIYRWAVDCGAECLGSTDIPNIWDTKVTHDLIVADAQILADRGYSMQEIAAHFGVKDDTVRRAHEKAGLTLRLHEWYTDPALRRFDGALRPGLEVTV